MATSVDEIISVSGTSNLFKMAANKSNGLILEDLASGKKKFYSAMRHQFTPLGTIAVYTLRDTVPLENVFRNMLQQHDDNPPVSPSVNKEEMEDYFMDILPDYDPKKVFHSDMKKIVKWYTFLKDNSLISLEDDPLVEEEE